MREQWERSEDNTAGEDETSQAETSERKNRRYACRLFGTNSLKEGAMWRICPILKVLGHRNSHC
jgi:hypothetical protein